MNIRENPSSENADEAFDIVKRNACDCIVALGGGSTIDAAKAVSIIAVSGPPAWDYVYSVARKRVTSTLPVVALPTTSGTGSHMTGYSVLSNDALGVKSTIVSAKICPAISIVDPAFTNNLDSDLTACTGFDSFSHSFESYINTKSNAATDMLAEVALPLVLTHLPIAIEEPENMESRIALAWADTLAGILIFNSGTTLPHAIGQPISGKLHHVRHGQTLAAVYQAFIEFSFPGRPDRFAKLAEWLVGKKSPGVPALEAARESVSAVGSFLDRIHLRVRLADFGLQRSDLQALAIVASESPDVFSNPVIASKEDIAYIYGRSF